MNDKRRIVMELVAGGLTADDEKALIQKACLCADMIIEATPDEDEDE